MAKSVTRKNVDATTFLTRFKLNALPPRQWSAQIMNPSADAAGEARAAPSPGAAAAAANALLPPRVTSATVVGEAAAATMRTTVAVSLPRLRAEKATAARTWRVRSILPTKCVSASRTRLLEPP